ncbi:protein PBDC1-like isoform X6 [Manis pentadactyla]|uniref:protein PBDC1-like isoform X6 n=2 Tax=Manis pentadactyla TaxID=143292 RepID=UPI00255CEF85|nr:protein PBDC1-like isoform X6 [Manis pentadactyla]
MGCNMEATRGTNEPVSGELVSVAHALSLPAESYGNDPDIEMAWAMRAMQHAEVYYKLISSVDPQFLKLTKVDDQIYSEFRENFERLRVDVLDPEELKSEAAKEASPCACCQEPTHLAQLQHEILLPGRKKETLPASLAPLQPIWGGAKRKLYKFFATAVPVFKKSQVTIVITWVVSATCFSFLAIPPS